MKKLMLIALILAFSASGVFAAKSTFSLPMPPIPADSSTQPDAFGYTWVDNDNGGSPVYDWKDITDTGIQVEGLADDNAVGPFDIGFDFPFYWYIVDHFYIGSNGYISFSSDVTYAQNFPAIPSTIDPDDLVVPLACDINFVPAFGDSGDCYYYTNNTDTLIVSWISVPEWNSPHDPNATHTFQLILCATDSSITYQYGEQRGSFQNPDGASQIGIEDQVGQNGLKYMHNLIPADRVPHDGLVIRIHADPDPDFIFHDVGIAGGMNVGSQAIFHPLNESIALRALVRNYGTTDEDNITVNCKVKKQWLFDPVYNENVTLDHIDSGEEIWVDFPIEVPGEDLNQLDSTYSLIFRTTLSGDQFFFNNTDTTEMRTYVLPMTFGYVDTVVSGTSWQGGGGGFANEFVMPEAIEITNISSFIFNDGVNDVYFYLLPALENGAPDESNILFGDTMSYADTGWVYFSIPDPIVIQANQKFFVATLSGGTGNAFGFDGSYPLSMRGWEHTGSYATSRDRSVQDQAAKFTADSHTTEGYEYLPGDANMPFGIWPPQCIGGDVTYLVNYFRGMNDPCELDGFWASADANGDCNIIGSDVTRLVQYFRGNTTLLYCPDYEPLWPTPDDLPDNPPAGWPNCETPVVSRTIPTGAIK